MKRGMDLGMERDLERDLGRDLERELERELDLNDVPLIRTFTMPGDLNANGSIFGGWILGELDKAAGLLAADRSKGRCTTVALEAVRFLVPLRAGEDFRVFGRVVSVGRTSMRLRLEGWARRNGGDARRIVEGTFVSVAIDEAGRPRPLPPSDDAPPASA